MTLFCWLLRPTPQPTASRFPFRKGPALAACVLAFTASVLPIPLRAQEAAAGVADAAPAAAPGALDVLPSQALGADDLVQIMVPYCPELSRSFRVASDGTLALPLLKQRIPVAGRERAHGGRRRAAARGCEQVL